jgi:hypothetical protein
MEIDKKNQTNTDDLMDDEGMFQDAIEELQSNSFICNSVKKSTLRPAQEVV